MTSPTDEGRVRLARSLALFVSGALSLGFAVSGAWGIAEGHLSPWTIIFIIPIAVSGIVTVKTTASAA